MLSKNCCHIPLILVLKYILFVASCTFQRGILETVNIKKKKRAADFTIMSSYFLYLFGFYLVNLCSSMYCYSCYLENFFLQQ